MMEGYITKIETIKEPSFHDNGVSIKVSFLSLPKTGERFYVTEFSEDTGHIGGWSTSVVRTLILPKVIEEGTIVHFTTIFSKYKLEITTLDN